MKITIYTTTACEFSKQEKEYLTSHNIQFEEKNLETNREFLKEMLAVSNNFAGTPVTKVEKDSGEVIVLKGFTEAEMAKELGLSMAGDAPAPDVQPANPKPAETIVPAVTDPITPVVEVPSTPAQPMAPPVVEAPVVPAEPIIEPAQPPAAPEPVVDSNPVQASAPTDTQLPPLEVPAAPAPAAPEPMAPTPSMPEPAQAPVQPYQTPEPMIPPVAEAPIAPEQPAQSTPQNDALNSILSSLQTNMNTGDSQASNTTT